MNITVFGAGGRTGLLTVFQALDKGYNVTAFARTPEKVTIRHKNLMIIHGNALDYEKVKEAVAGQDVIISTIGNTGRKRSTELSDGTANIISAMKETGVKRIIVMSSAGILGNDGGFWFGKIILPLILREVFEDKRRQMKAVMESSLEWVIIRPTGLTDSPKTGRYKVREGIPKGTTVPRADVADFMLKLLTDKQWDHKMPSISSK